MKITCVLLYCCCLVQPAVAQSNCFARVELDRHNVYVQQPLKVTFTVMTTTWYTAPLAFNNLQVPDAYIVPFTSATPGQYGYNGKQYAGVQFYYLVFPYKPGNYHIPAIEIVATSPPEGSPQSRKVTVRTTPQPYVVKPVPHGFPAGEEWMVAKNVTVQEKWSRSFDSLKTGDVLERTITINATGTVPQFISPTKLVQQPWAGIYPQAAQLKDTRTDSDANGERVERSTYLLLKPGNYELPGTTVYWWDPFAGRLYKQHTPDRNIRIYDNPQLGMLATLKDSLAATVQPAPAAKKGLLRVLGMPWYWALLYALVLAAGIWGLVLLVLMVVHRWQRRYAAYRQSELYWFRQFMHVPPGATALLQQLYQWWDRLTFPGKLPAVRPALTADEELAQTFRQYLEKKFKLGIADPAIAKLLQQQLRLFRKKKLREKEEGESLPAAQRPWPDKV